MTKTQIISALKLEHPTIRVGSEETGYTELDETEYAEMINSWAENVIAREAEAAFEIDQEAARLAILEKLGVTDIELRVILNK
jgi:hypothetical protein